MITADSSRGLGHPLKPNYIIQGDERLIWSKRHSKRTQVANLVNDLLSKWNIKRSFIGTGDPDNPTIIDDLVLPKIWERKHHK